jgi:hypothetical protein
MEFLEYLLETNSSRWSDVMVPSELLFRAKPQGM